MKNYYDNALGFEATLPIEIIRLLDGYKTKVEEQSKDNHSSRYENLALDEHELAITG
ncbi:MAG: hypothetical protein KAQ91_04995 [Methylococcales bacterium]|nr:hypothetical protein [Methylococcales bacterium]